MFPRLFYRMLVLGIALFLTLSLLLVSVMSFSGSFSLTPVHTHASLLAGGPPGNVIIIENA